MGQSLIDLYMLKRFDFSLPLTPQRMQLLNICIYRHQDLTISNMVPIDLIRYLIQLLAIDILKEPDKFMVYVNRHTTKLLNILNSDIFKYNEEDYDTEEQLNALKKQYERYIQNLEKQEKESNNVS